MTNRPQHSNNKQNETQDDKEESGDISKNLQLFTLNGLDVSAYTDETQASGGQQKPCCRQQVFPCIHGIGTAETSAARRLPSQFAMLYIQFIKNGLKFDLPDVFVWERSELVNEATRGHSSTSLIVLL